MERAQQKTCWARSFLHPFIKKTYNKKPQRKTQNETVLKHSQNKLKAKYAKSVMFFIFFAKSLDFYIYIYTLAPNMHLAMQAKSQKKQPTKLTRPKTESVRSL